MTNPTNQASGVAERAAERAQAEAAYTLEAYNYPRDPVGSRDWTLYYGGWLHRATLANKPAAPAEVVAISEGRLHDLADSEECNPNTSGWGSGFDFIAFGRAVEREVIAALRTPAQAPADGDPRHARTCPARRSVGACDCWQAPPVVQSARPAVEVAKWIDDPHDIEQGQMLNPEWLKHHGVTAQQVHQQAQTPFSPATPHPAVAVPGSLTELREALRELLETSLLQMPSAEHGKAAQDEWADRRAAARNNAEAALATTSTASQPPGAATPKGGE